MPCNVLDIPSFREKTRIFQRSIYDILPAFSRIVYTGDVGTVASIALAAASHSAEIRQDLPESLRPNLEDDPYGRQYIESMDVQLLRSVPK